jgi:hypothetical protein
MRRPLLWAFAAFFMVSGATWLISMIWRNRALDVAPLYSPHIIAALLVGATFARVLDRRKHAIACAAGAMLAWIVFQLVAFTLHGSSPRWSASADSAAHFAILAALAIPAAAAAASLRLVGRPDHRLLWLWISALMMLGTIVAPLTILTADQSLPTMAAIVIFAAPVLAGAMTQVLKPFRAIWTSGGGALVFVLMLLDDTFRGRDDDIVGPLLGMGVFFLLGALGARVGWRLFRNADARKPPTDLPTATAS